MRLVIKLYDAEYIVKVDDDVYFRLDRLPSTVLQWSSMQKGVQPKCISS